VNESRYLALLRGINVGGKNIVRMADLRAGFEGLGFRDVATYIQSGNVLFTPSGASRKVLTRRIEKALAEAFGIAGPVVLRDRDELRQIVHDAPKGFGSEPGRYRYDVLFLKEPLTARVAMESVTLKEGVDEAHAGDGVLYFSRLDSRASQSRLSKLASLPVYKSMTVRNWNTTTKLQRMMEEP
jgi:uncharacterized protein (DUF1697 family)